MKKILLTSIVVLSVVAGTTVSSFANVIFPSGQNGHPISGYSNPGSLQGQANMSTTGHYSKTTYDGWWDFW